MKSRASNVESQRKRLEFATFEERFRFALREDATRRGTVSNATHPLSRRASHALVSVPAVEKTRDETRVKSVPRARSPDKFSSENLRPETFFLRIINRTFVSARDNARPRPRVDEITRLIRGILDPCDRVTFVVVRHEVVDVRKKRFERRPIWTIPVEYDVEHRFAAARLERLEVLRRLLALQMLHHEESADVKNFRLLRPRVGNIGDGELRVGARRAHETTIFVLDVHDQRATGAHIRRATHAGNVDKSIRERFQNIIAKRQEEADKQLLEAAQKQEAAAVLEQKYSDTLNNIEEEKKKALSEARKDADTAYQKIIDDANKKADKIKEDAVIEAENTKTQIIKKAEKEIADMVVSAATKVVAGTDNVSADNSLYDEFLNKAGEE